MTEPTREEMNQYNEYRLYVAESKACGYEYVSFAEWRAADESSDEG